MREYYVLLAIDAEDSEDLKEQLNALDNKELLWAEVNKNVKELKQ